MSLDLETSSLKSNTAGNIWFTAHWKGEWRQGDFLQEGKLGWGKLLNLSRGLSCNLQLQLNCREMSGWERAAAREFGSQLCGPSSPANQLCDLELVTHWSCLWFPARIWTSSHARLWPSDLVHSYWLLWALAGLLGFWVSLQNCHEVGEPWFHVFSDGTWSSGVIKPLACTLW